MLPSGIWWEQFRQATCMPLNCFCEGAGNLFIRQPVNTLTNLFFVAIGILILRIPQKHIPAKLNTTLGLTVITLGLTSFYYHMSLTFSGQWLDNLGMYIIASFVFSSNLWREFRPKRFFISMGTMSVISGVVAYFYPDARRELFAATIILGFSGEMISLARGLRGHMIYLGLTIVCFIIGISFWYVDLTKIWCEPTLWINGHGLWHTFIALTCWFYYQYLKSRSQHEVQAP